MFRIGRSLFLAAAVLFVAAPSPTQATTETEEVTVVVAAACWRENDVGKLVRIAQEQNLIKQHELGDEMEEQKLCNVVLVDPQKFRQAPVINNARMVQAYPFVPGISKETAILLFLRGKLPARTLFFPPFLNFD